MVFQLTYNALLLFLALEGIGVAKLQASWWPGREGGKKKERKREKRERGIERCSMTAE